MELYLHGIGLCTQGLPNWSTGRDVLAGVSPYCATEIIMAASPLLPPAERRRTTDAVKLAMTVAGEAVAHAGLRAEDTIAVFASSGGDGREVSPTRFHNSVHNAPAGYWSIATRCREASTSICAHDYSFAAGLIEAATRALVEQRPTLLVAYDLPYPPALASCRTIAAPFGTALVISPHRSDTALAALSIDLRQKPIAETALDDSALEALRAGVPAARALPMLTSVARGEARETVIPYVAGSGVAIRVTPVMHAR